MISIHAPVKGATDAIRPQGLSATISIHAPVKGATRQSCGHRSDSLYFNPRSREGSDQLPVRFCLAGGYFNPRSREGSDFRRSRIPLIPTHFNPRSREGSDSTMIHPMTNI